MSDSLSKNRWKSVLGIVLMFFVGAPLAVYGLLMLMVAGSSWGGPWMGFVGPLLLGGGVTLVWQASKLI